MSQLTETPKRAGPTLLVAANTPQAIYTAPGSVDWSIVRDITIVNETGGQVAVTYGIASVDTDAAGRRLLKSFPLAPGGVPYTWGGFIPLAPNEILYALCDTNNGATVTVAVVEGSG